MADTFSAQDRLTLIQRLSTLPELLFRQVTYASQVPRGLISAQAPQATQAKEFLDWVEGPTGCGLDNCRALLGKIAPADRDYASNLPRPRIFQAPPLPPFFVPRPDQQQDLKAMLLAETNTLVMSAVYGLGGIGKSVLASALAHDPEVQAGFPDGILWATLGQQPDILPLLSGWIQALGDYNYKPTNVDAAALHLRTLLYGQQVLLVVDDVWDPDHAEPFRVGDSGSCVLVTTREAKIPEATAYRLDVMSRQQALDLLGGALNKAPAQPAQVEQIAEAVGYLPLALELVAAQIEDGATWDELLDDLDGEITQLDSLDRLTPDEQPSDAKRRRHSLIACFNLSLKRLTPLQLQQFAWLGVLPEDISVSDQMVATLWQLKPRAAGKVLRILRNKALLLDGSETFEGKPTYRMHDLMHDLAVQLLAAPVEPEASEALPGLGLPHALAHQQLLESYRSQLQDGQWHTVPYDGYIHSRLSWHFEQAEQSDWLHGLLQETTEAGRNGWYEACERLGQTASFITDVGRAWTLAEQAYESQPTESIVLQWRYALITTTLNSLAQNISPELIARFVEKQFWAPAKGLAYVRQTQEPTQKGKGIRLLAPLLPPVLLGEAMTIARKLHPETLQVWTLCTLAAYGSRSWFEEALEEARNIQDEYERFEALSILVAYGSGSFGLESLFEELLKAARSIQDEDTRVIALSELVAHGPESLFEEALEAAHTLQDLRDRAYALIRLAAYRPELLFEEALAAAHNLQDPSDRAHAFSSLAAHGPESLFEEALNAIRNIQDERNCATALSKLAADGPELLFEEALNTVRSLQNLSARVSLLIELVTYGRGPESLFGEALEAVRSIPDQSTRASALSKLAAHGPEFLFEEGLEVAQSIQDPSDRAYALCQLATHGQESLFEEALKAVRSIPDQSTRASALSKLAVYLPESLFDKALSIAREIQNEEHRASALNTLAAYLPKLLFEEGLATARKIQNEDGHALILSKLAVHSESLFEEAVEAARSIQEEHDRSEALSALAVHGPESLYEEALEAACNAEEILFRADAISSLAPDLPESLLEKALEAVLNIQDKYDRARALQAFLDRLQWADIDLWKDVLHALAAQGRPNFIQGLPKLRSAIVKFGGETALMEIVQAMKEVCTQWP